MHRDAFIATRQLDQISVRTAHEPHHVAIIVCRHTTSDAQDASARCGPLFEVLTTKPKVVYSEPRICIEFPCNPFLVDYPLSDHIPGYMVFCGFKCFLHIAYQCTRLSLHVCGVVGEYEETISTCDVPPLFLLFLCQHVVRVRVRMRAWAGIQRCYEHVRRRSSQILL